MQQKTIIIASAVENAVQEQDNKISNYPDDKKLQPDGISKNKIYDTKQGIYKNYCPNNVVSLVPGFLRDLP